VLTISDNGIGLSEDLDFKNTDSLGLQLVNSLINQIDGEIELNKDHGTNFKIKFKELKYAKRL
jgi:two-component sensor histidine kinase